MIHVQYGDHYIIITYEASCCRQGQSDSQPNLSSTSHPYSSFSEFPPSLQPPMPLAQGELSLATALSGQATCDASSPEPAPPKPHSRLLHSSPASSVPSRATRLSMFRFLASA